MFDQLIRNGTVVDGSGRPGFAADVAIRNDRIADIGRIPESAAASSIDATGLVVAPGFIDAHVHGDLVLLAQPRHDQALAQGVTTYILGQDGVAFAPGTPATQQYMRRYTAGFNGNFATPGRTWTAISNYLTQFDGDTPLNVAVLIPNGNVRMDVMGLDPRRPTAKELRSMRRIIREGMDQGAVGLSSGLDYIPSLYAEEAELTELCREIAPDRGVYVTHMRGYTPANAPTALAEVFAIGRGAGCPVHISHFNCLADQAIPILEQAQSDCTFDLYCYLYGSTTVAMLTLPADVCVGGIDATLDRLRDPAIRKMLIPSFKNPRFPLETIRLASCPHPDWRQYEGQFLTAAAGSRPVVDFVCDLLIATDLAAGCVIRHFADRQESDILKLMRHPAMMAGSDGIFIGGFPHPRGAGCFARYLGHHVRRGDWPLEEAVRKCSFAAAERFQLKDRGIIRPGAFADLAIFDPVRFTDQSTLTNGRALAIGMKWVFVNGSCVFDGRPTGQTPGRALRRGES